MRVDSEVGAGLWPRAAALLTRQGLELALADLWAVIAPGLGEYISESLWNDLDCRTLRGFGVGQMLSPHACADL